MTYDALVVGAGQMLFLRPMTGLPVGAVHYTAWYDDMGKILDDVTLFRVGEHEYRLCCQERHLPWLLDSAEGMSVAIADVTDHVAALSLQGNVPAEHSLIYDDRNREVGHITAAAWSPAAKRNIAIAHLRRPSDTERPDKLMVEVYAQRELQYVKLMLKATICERPFFSPGRRRATPPDAH